jgi:hypothetical protein
LANVTKSGTTPRTRVYNPRMGAPFKLTPHEQAQVLAEIVGGQPMHAVAAAHGVTRGTIWRILKRGDNPEFIKQLRGELRARTQARLRKITPRVLDALAVKLASKGSAPDIDALARAVLNLEKTAASVSGELKANAQAGAVVQVLLPGWAAPAQAALPAPVDTAPAHAVTIAPVFEITPPPTP